MISLWSSTRAYLTRAANNLCMKCSKTNYNLMKCCHSLSNIIADILALMSLLLFSCATARAERDLSSLSCVSVFLCVEWGHPLWDPIDTSLGDNWLPNQNAGLQPHDNKKKQEDGGHFVVSCGTMPIYASLVFALCWEDYINWDSHYGLLANRQPVHIVELNTSILATIRFYREI